MENYSEFRLLSVVLRLNKNGISTRRRFIHETTFEIVVYSAAGFVFGSFLKALLSDLGKLTAQFIGETLKKLSSEKVDHVRFKGVRTQKKGTGRKRRLKPAGGRG